MQVERERGYRGAIYAAGSCCDRQPRCLTCNDLEWIDSNGFGELETAFAALKLATERGCTNCSVIFQGISAFSCSSSWPNVRLNASDRPSGIWAVAQRRGTLLVHVRYWASQDPGTVLEFYRLEGMIVLEILNYL
jgi:hypothetical protein